MKKIIKKITIGLMAITLLLSPLNFTSAISNDIIDTAINTPELSTLTILVTEAELVDTLKSPGPFTVFAPTNEAFEQMPRIVKKALQKNPELLTDILLYHVVSADITSADIPRATIVDSIQGSKILARNNNQGVFINRAEVIIPDVVTSNGTVHIIDRVLIPWKAVAQSIRANK